MRSAVIVSTARTPIGRAYRGAFNNLPSATLGSHAIRAAVERARVEAGEVEDVVFGSGLQQGGQANNIARHALLRAGLPTSVPGMSLDRQCASGLMAIATAAKQIIVDGMDVTVGGGVESISLVQTPQMRVDPDPELLAMHDDIYMPMLQTAEVVGARYAISRERCDAYGLQSQQRAPAYFGHHPPPTHPGDLAHHQCIGCRSGPGGALYRWTFERAGEAITLDVDGPLVTDDADLMLHAALSGIGLWHGIDLVAQPMIAEGRLLRVLADWSPTYPGFHVYYASGAPLSASVRAVVDVLKSAGKQPPFRYSAAP